MNRLEARISLAAITFFAAIQYAFLARIPGTISHLAFLCITDVGGILVTLPFFLGDLPRLDRRQVAQCVVLAVELMAFNLFLLLGTSGTSPVVASAVLSAWFVPIAVAAALSRRTGSRRASLLGCGVTLLGLFMMMDADASALLDRSIAYLVMADLAFALYIVTAGRWAVSSCPSLLALGQMSVRAVLALVSWGVEVHVLGRSSSLPPSVELWQAVLYTSVFIRGLQSVVQLYAQRWVGPLETSLIFSTEIVMALAVSPVLSRLLGTMPEPISLSRMVGAVVMVMGILMTEPSFVDGALGGVLRACGARAR